MVIMALSLLACSPASTEVFVEVPCDDFMNQKQISGQVEITPGELFTVTLCSNPTTGHQWQSPQITDQTVLEQVDHKFEAPEHKGDRPPPPGTPGKEVWTFKALKKGEATISMEYSQPWEGGLKATWTFILTVVVK